MPSIPAVLSKRLGAAACPSNRHLLYSLEQRQVGFTTGLTIKTKFPRNNSQNTNRRAAMRQRVPPEQVVPRIQNRIWAVFRARTSDEICNWCVTIVTGLAKIIIIIKNWSSSDGTWIFLHKTLDLKFSSQENEGISIFGGIFPSDLGLDDQRAHNVSSKYLPHEGNCGKLTAPKWKQPIWLK